MTGIIKESELLLNKIGEWQMEEGSKLSKGEDEGYGHALRTLGMTMISDGRKLSPEEQAILLRERALELIEKYGENIKRVMKPELLEALGIEDQTKS